MTDNNNNNNAINNTTTTTITQLTQNAQAHDPASSTSTTTSTPASILVQWAQAAQNTTDAIPEAKQLLTWQTEAGTSNNWQKFRGEALGQMDLQVFGFMNKGSPYINLIHTIQSYTTLGTEADLKGKDIGFVGDKNEYQVPTPVIMQKEKPWKWIAKSIYNNPDKMMEHYNNDENNGKLWNPDVSLTIRVPA